MLGPDDPASAIHFEALAGVPTRTTSLNQTTAPPKEISSETPPGNHADLTSLAPALNTTLTQPEGLDAAALLSILSMNQPSAKSSPIDKGKGLAFDPFMFSNHKACNKLSDIRGFVTVTLAKQRGVIELNLPETKPKLDSNTPMQYMEATLRILREMATKVGTSFPQVLQYVSYLIKVANMGQRF